MKYLIPLIIIAVFLSLFKLGTATLFDVDEAVFSEATKEMVESGDWITPTYNGKNRYDKPILYYWFMALSYEIFGINEFGARFPSAISSLLLALIIFLFVRRFRDEKTAFYAALSCVLSIYFVVYSHAAVTDMTLTLFITLSLFSFYHASIRNTVPDKKTNIYICAFYAFSALAFLTKGLIGIIFPFGIAMIYIDITEGWRGIKRIVSIKGILLFLIIAAPWYIGQTAINSQEFINAFFVKHHFKRYFSVISSHTGPLYYYLPVLLLGLFPWVLFLPSGIRNTLKGKDNLNVFSLVWLFAIFVFFSLSTTKLPNYLLPAIPAASILIASGMFEHEKRWFRYSNLFMTVVSLLTGAAFIISGKYLTQAGAHNVDWTILPALVMLGIMITGLYAFFTKKTPYAVLSVLMVAFLTILLSKALPLANQFLQGTLHKYSLYAKYRLQKDEQLFECGTNNPSIVFYSDRKIIPVRGKDDVLSITKEYKDKKALAITKTDDIDMLRNSCFSLLEKDANFAIFEKNR
jgi:4-amino-4-deoxy-L-arabinose transferase-like glycosyltransferase